MGVGFNKNVTLVSAGLTEKCFIHICESGILPAQKTFKSIFCNITLECFSLLQDTNTLILRVKYLIYHVEKNMLKYVTLKCYRNKRTQSNI